MQFYLIHFYSKGTREALRRMKPQDRATVMHGLHNLESLLTDLREWKPAIQAPLPQVCTHKRTHASKHTGKYFIFVRHTYAWAARVSADMNGTAQAPLPSVCR